MGSSQIGSWRLRQTGGSRFEGYLVKTARKRQGYLSPPDTMDPNYFVQTHRGITAFILVSLFYLMPAGLMRPHLLPPLGVVRELFLGFISNNNDFSWSLYRISMYIHITEAFIALILCVRYR